MKFEAIAYEHAAALISQDPWDVSRNAELLCQAQSAAIERYQYLCSVVGLDIYNIEIEAYGCEILRGESGSVPVAGDPLFVETDELLSLNLNPKRDGRLPMIFSAAHLLRQAFPNLDIKIPISGPFTIACHLIGMENMICELFTEPEDSVHVLNHLADQQIKVVQEANAKGFGISLFESSVTPPLLSPDLFTNYVQPVLKRILEVCACTSQLIIGGNTQPIVAAICALPCDYIICPVETDQALFMQDVAKRKQHVRINMNPSVFLPGCKNEALAEFERVYVVAKDWPNVSVGALLPYDADPDVVQRVINVAATR